MKKTLYFIEVYCADCGTEIRYDVDDKLVEKYKKEFEQRTYENDKFRYVTFIDKDCLAYCDECLFGSYK